MGAQCRSSRDNEGVLDAELQHRQSILEFWRMLELFSPQALPRPQRRATRPTDRQVIEWTPDEPLPWRNLPAPKPIGKTKQVWQHAVYLGVYNIEDAYESLHRLFVDDSDAYDVPEAGTSACAGLLIDQDGRVVSETPVLSAALWAMARLKYPGPADPRWAQGFETASAEFAAQVDKYDAHRREAAGADKPLPHDGRSLRALVNRAHQASGISEPKLATGRILISSQVVSSRLAEASEFDFLNSFYLNDLDTVLASDQHGAALKAYLTSDSQLQHRERVDVITRPEVLDSGTRIERLPKGRWPSNPDHPLALSQQFAVNHALVDLLPTKALMGVNGPPGTGKTTMLRDILAGNVVERASRLAVLIRPTDAFTADQYIWNSPTGHRRRLPQLIDELTGFEMVLASANNGAVENVSTEIPVTKAIAPLWRDKADYFADIASTVMRKTATQPDQEPPSAWGLVAARLGRKQFRKWFFSAFWFDDSDEPGLDTLLKQWASGEREFTPWSQARAQFQRAQRRVDELLAERSAAAKRMEELPHLQRQQRQLGRTLERLSQELRQTTDDLARHEEARQRIATEVRAAQTVYDRHLGIKPNFLEMVFSLGAAVRQWRGELVGITSRLREAESADAETTAKGQRLLEGVATIRRAIADTREDLANAGRRLEKLRRSCLQDQLRYGPSYPGPDWVGEQRQLRAPWLDSELDRARSELFLAALTLHRDFLANTARLMRPSLRAAMDVVIDECPRHLGYEKVRAAWQLFFMVVPLVSTTFASLGRMFRGVGPEAIGWLLIDEAGQAPPQQAVGGIWRAKRVVIVGDPLQLQPVVTIPPKLERDIAASYGVSDTWLPPVASVQTLADRLAKYGTSLPQADRDVWVSAPLTVHRRCDDPMFRLCNEIAYNSMMVRGVVRLPDPAHPGPFDETPYGPLVAPSHWVDEPAIVSGSHLQPQEIARLEKALRYLSERGVPPSEIIALSPFRPVADALSRLTHKYEGLIAGTIHTAQGREAPVVFLVLGGDPAKPGAKAWASSTVNLVNVAASRAQRRLYVIGDRAAWTKYNYFRQLAEALGAG